MVGVAEPPPYLEKPLFEFLRERIIKAHRLGPLLAHEQEQMALAAILPALRIVRDEMLQREELDLTVGRYTVTDFVPKPIPEDPGYSYTLRYRKLVVEIGTFGHTCWKLGDVVTDGPRHISLETLQHEMKRVEAWSRDQTPTPEEFRAKVYAEEFWEEGL